MRFSYERSGFGPTLPAHPFLASSPCQRAEELSSFDQFRTASPRLPEPPPLQREAGLYQSVRHAVNFFFCGTPFFSGAPGGASRLRQSRFPTLRRGRLFNSAPGALSTSFFAPKLFYFGKQRRLPLLYFSPPQRILRFISEARFLPQGRNPVNPFFRSTPKFPPDHPREAVAALRAPNLKIAPSVGEAAFYAPGQAPSNPFSSTRHFF